MKYEIVFEERAYPLTRNGDGTFSAPADLSIPAGAPYSIQPVPDEGDPQPAGPDLAVLAAVQRLVMRMSAN